MKNILKTLFILCTFTVLLSFTKTFDNEKLVGTWKVEKIEYDDGRIKNGRKTITFFADQTFISVKDTGSEMKGYWSLDDDSKIINTRELSKEKWVEFIILELSKNKLVVKSKDKTAYLVKVKTKKN